MASQEASSPTLVELRVVGQDSSEEAKIEVDTVLSKFKESDWLRGVKESLLASHVNEEQSELTFEYNQEAKEQEDSVNVVPLEQVTLYVAFNEPLINELLSQLAFAADSPDHEQLPQEFYSRKPIQASAVAIYQNMLNACLPASFVFIFDSDLTDSVRACYSRKTSRVNRQDLLAEVHRRTDGILLTDFAKGLVFTAKTVMNSQIISFDLIHVEPGKAEIEGRKAQDSYLSSIRAFLQDYMYQTQVQRQQANQSKATGPVHFMIASPDYSRCKVKHVDQQMAAGLSPVDTILSLRQIC